MPSAFDRGVPQDDHSPLANQLDFAAGNLPFTVDALLDLWLKSFNDFIVPVVKEVTGLDLSSPEAFIVSVATMIVNGGNAVIQLMEAIVSPIFAAIKSLTGIDLGTIFNGLKLGNPGAILGGIQESVNDLVNTVIQPIIDAIHQAFTGASQIGNDVTAIIQALFNPIKLFNNALALIQSIFGDLGGHAGGLDARISALEAQALGAAGLVSGDNFNRATIGSTWTNVVGTLLISSGDYVKTSSRAAAYYNAGGPSTDRHGVAVKLVDRSAGDCQFWMCGDTGMTNFVGVEVHAGIFGDDYIQLFTGSSPTVGVAQAQESFVSNLFGQNSLRSGDVIALNYDEITNTYTVTRNSKVIDDLTWTDTTNIVTHGPTKRNTGVVTNSLNQHQFPGFGITDFVYYDRSTT